MKKVYFLLLIFTLLFAGSAFAAAKFQIVSFDLFDDTSELISLPVAVDAGSSVDVTAVVTIRNIGDAAGNAVVNVIIKNMKGDEMVLTPPLSSWTSTNLASDDRDNHSFVVDVPGSWGAGLYSFYANVNDGAPPLHDQELKTLTLAITKPNPIPELDFVFIPLLALSVLAVLFFADKRHSGKI